MTDRLIVEHDDLISDAFAQFHIRGLVEQILVYKLLRAQALINLIYTSDTASVTASAVPNAAQQLSD
jgi:hypothetical protein